LCSDKGPDSHGTKDPSAAAELRLLLAVLLAESELWFRNSRRTDAIKSLRTNRRHIRKLKMARRNFGGDAKTRPVVHTNGKVSGTQHSEAEAGCVPENELECTCRQLRRLRQQSRGGHDACWVEQLGGRTGVGVVKASRNQNLAGWEQGREMVATPTNQR